jgi:hypothetical protein
MIFFFIFLINNLIKNTLKFINFLLQHYVTFKHQQKINVEELTKLLFFY